MKLHYLGNKVFFYFFQIWASVQNILESVSGLYEEYSHSWAFPGGPVAKTLHFQGRGPGLDPWSGNYIPHATT